MDVLQHGQWQCNSRTEECMLNCDTDYIRIGTYRKNCTCTEDYNCSLTPQKPAYCESANGLQIFY